MYGIDIEPIRFRDGKMDERRVCGEATFDCICHRGRWVKGADDPHDGVWDQVTDIARRWRSECIR